MEPRPSIRASDADRERVAQRLRDASLEGRLSADELDERLGHAFAAVSYGDLDRLIADLPVPPWPVAARAPARVRRPAARRGATASLALVVLALDLMVVGRFDHLVHEAHGMGVTSVIRAVGLIGVAHAAEAGIAALCVVLVLVATAGWALSQGWPNGSWTPSSGRRSPSGRGPGG